mmetsp:Transcript_19360/g.46607  ORF Transcript_19360/g.46607 Transcript_19360/m.46607 type:complete len:246 (-) Transcript_19360:900-1637(-)
MHAINSSAKTRDVCPSTCCIPPTPSATPSAYSEANHASSPSESGFGKSHAPTKNFNPFRFSSFGNFSNSGMLWSKSLSVTLLSQEVASTGRRFFRISCTGSSSCSRSAANLNMSSLMDIALDMPPPPPPRNDNWSPIISGAPCWPSPLDAGLTAWPLVSGQPSSPRLLREPASSSSAVGFRVLLMPADCDGGEIRLCLFACVSIRSNNLKSRNKTLVIGAWVDLGRESLNSEVSLQSLLSATNLK